MRYLFMITLAVLMISPACKTCKKSQDKTNNAEQTNAGPGTVGKVSHQYQSGGCATVILVKLEDAGEMLTLIPKDPLPREFDVDGKQISFDYRLLRMPNPAGCAVGIPAELTNISAK
jgi:hypothetical protein